MVFDQVLCILKTSCCSYGVLLCMVSRNEQKIGNKVDLYSSVLFNPCQCLKIFKCKGHFCICLKNGISLLVN